MMIGVSNLGSITMLSFGEPGCLEVVKFTLSISFSHIMICSYQLQDQNTDLFTKYKVNLFQWTINI